MLSVGAGISVTDRQVPRPLKLAMARALGGANLVGDALLEID